MEKNKTAQWVDISKEVQDALKTDKAVVALESTIISHGMPYPQNLETALAVENIIRNEGAFPATIAVSGGRIKIGLSRQELQQFAQNSDPVKVSRRDLPVVLTQKLSGGTTVAATMICAQIAGIPVFVTGGIGGVHRENEKTMDVSADLMELAHTNVAVVCAGIKSILDIPRTLEYLETHGVPVIGYQTAEFPSFYTPSSGSMVQTRIDTPEDIARCMKIKWDLGLAGGLVIGNPVRPKRPGRLWSTSAPKKPSMAEDGFSAISAGILSAKTMTAWMIFSSVFSGTTLTASSSNAAWGPVSSSTARDTSSPITTWWKTPIKSR